MAFDSTITEQDMDVQSRQSVQNMHDSRLEGEPDLDVDGLSDSIAARMKRFLAFGRN